MVAYQFRRPGARGQRSAKFAKYLPVYGWEPVVLTRDAYNMQLRDHTLLEDLPAVWGIRAFRDLGSSRLSVQTGKFVAWKVRFPTVRCSG